MNPFVTKKQIGQLLLGWIVIMAVLFLWELAERGGLLHIFRLSLVLRPLCAALFAVWLARRHARDTAGIELKDAWIFGLICVICFFLLNYADANSFSTRIAYSLSRIMGIEDGFNSVFVVPNGMPKEPRHMFYWFLCVSYIDYDPLCSLLFECGVYGVVKAICIKHNLKEKRLIQ